MKKSPSGKGCFLVTHGLSKTPEYKVWKDMRRRCYNPKRNNYARYGGKGIFVSDVWLNDFAAFYRDMGPRPTNRHTIDRIDGSGPYSPENCQWATYSEQRNNSSSVTLREFQGQMLNLTEIGARTGMDPRAIKRRLKRGWTWEQAISLPLGTCLRCL